MASFKTVINSWAAGAASAAEAAATIQQQREGAYARIMEAGAIWEAEHGTGEDSANEFRAALKVQQDNVWSLNPAKYGAILKESKGRDGEVTVVLSGSAMNAISVIKGAIGHGLDLSEEDRTFKATKAEVAALNRGPQSDQDAEVQMARECILEELTALRGLVRKLDDIADLDPLQAAVCALRNEVAGTIDRNRKAEAEGDKTGKPMSEGDKAALSELKAAAKAKAKAAPKAAKGRRAKAA